MKYKCFVKSFILLFLVGFNVFVYNTYADEVLNNISVLEGFKVEYYYKGLPKARAMKYIGDGILIVGSRDQSVYMVIDTNRDFKGDIHRILVNNLDWPVGVDVYKGDLYISSVDRIVKIENVLLYTNFSVNPNIKVVFDKYPKDRWHGWKYIRFGPDGKLYVPVGAPCNVCLKSERIFSSITRINPDGSGFEIFAEGIRNSVGFDWDPKTGYMWFTENGRDWMGDNLPPDEVNVAKNPGNHYGFPFVHGSNVKDPEFSDKTNLTKFNFVKPIWELPAHVAPLGIKFYKGNSFPYPYIDGIFIAEHGSWNRSAKIGYRVSFLKLDENRKPVDYVIFASWLKGQKVYGRPVDIEFLEDGSMLVSDDYYGNIFRIYYKKN